MASPVRFSASAAVVIAVLGAVSAYKDCYEDGERCIGAKGYDYVPYKKCCSGKPHMTVDFDWGSWCGAPKHAPKKCAVATYDGYDTTGYEACGHGYSCVVPVSSGYGGWYKDTDKHLYCMPSGDHIKKDDGKYYAEHACYKDGERCMGEHGYDYVPYMPCCTGVPAKKMNEYGEYDWGYYCVPRKEPVVEYKVEEHVCKGHCTGKVIPCGTYEKCCTDYYGDVVECPKEYSKKCYSDYGVEVLCKADACYNKSGFEIACEKDEKEYKCYDCYGKGLEDYECDYVGKCCYDYYGWVHKCPMKVAPSPEYYY